MTTTRNRAEALRTAGALDADTQSHAGVTPSTTEHRPTVPARVRDVVYYVGLGVASTVLVVTGTVGVWLPDIAPQVAATGVVIGQGMALITAGLGVVYRPGAQRS